MRYLISFSLLKKVIPNEESKLKIPCYYSALLPYEEAIPMANEHENIDDANKTSHSIIMDTNNKDTASFLESES